MSNTNQTVHRGVRGPSVGSMNCNGLGNKVKRDLVLNWLKDKKEDIFFLQETHSTIESERDWTRSWGGRVYFNHGSSNSTGVAILIKSGANHIKVEKHSNIVNGRASLLEIDIDGVLYCLTNIYAPNNDDVGFHESVFLEALGRNRDDHLIMAGDWNAILSNTLDKTGGSSTHNSHRSQNFLNSMISDYGLSDVFRVNSGDARLYTHFNKKCKTATRLDFF